MPFKKDDPNINRTGRPKASASIMLRQHITEYCEENLQVFLIELKNHKAGKVKFDAFIQLLRFCIPVLSEQNSVFNIDALTDEQINSLLKKLTDEH